MDENEWSNKVIGVCIDVHRALGLGLLESVYQECREFSLQDVPFQNEITKAVFYKGILTPPVGLIPCGLPRLLNEGRL